MMIMPKGLSQKHSQGPPRAFALPGLRADAIGFFLGCLRQPSPPFVVFIMWYYLVMSFLLALSASVAGCP